jgi:hypothetical protein
MLAEDLQNVSHPFARIVPDEVSAHEGISRGRNRYGLGDCGRLPVGESDSRGEHFIARATIGQISGAEVSREACGLWLSR